jgi:hypothetical protein
MFLSAFYSVFNLLCFTAGDRTAVPNCHAARGVQKLTISAHVYGRIDPLIEDESGMKNDDLLCTQYCCSAYH